MKNEENDSGQQLAQDTDALLGLTEDDKKDEEPTETAPCSGSES